MGKISRALEKFSNREKNEQRDDAYLPHEEEQRHPREQSNVDAEPIGQTGGSGLSEPHYQKWDERLTKVTGFSSMMSESFRVLRSRIIHSGERGGGIKSILVTSAAREEGKTFISANLAVSLAQALDQHCLVVDCDLRRPALAELFGLQKHPGLSEYLQEKCDVAQTIQKTTVEKLSLLACGRPPVNPSELIGSIRMQGLVKELSSRYEDRFLILDSPPMRIASESAVLAKQVDSVVVVVRWGASGREHIKKLVEEIGREKIIGIVFNGYKTNLVEDKIFKYSEYYEYNYNPKA